MPGKRRYIPFVQSYYGTVPARNARNHESTCAKGTYARTKKEVRHGLRNREDA